MSFVMNVGSGVLFVVMVGVAAAGCEPEASSASQVTLRAEQEVLPGFTYSTGLQPAGSPVQASFDLAASGLAVVEAKGQPSGSESAPELTGVAGSGVVRVTGGFSMVGTLKIDVDGLPSYDGPIPGIENVAIAFEAETPFDPWAIDAGLAARAAIPPSRLPPIPLPGGIPGSLVLEVAEGSFVEVTFTASFAAIEGTTASYEGEIARAGSLVIAPSVEIEVPFLGTQVFDIPSFTVDLALGSELVSMTATVSEYGGSIEGDKAKVGACSGAGEGGAGTGGQGAGGDGPGGAGEGGAGGAGCPYAVSLGPDQEELATCLNESCCLELGVCTEEGQDFDSCNACLQSSQGGPLCDALVSCMNESCNDGFEICDSGYQVTEQACAECLGEPACCQAFHDCSNDVDCDECLATGAPTACESPLIPAIDECVATCGCS